MRVVVVGMGIQGTKRKNIAGTECVATVDPIRDDATYKRIQDVPLDSYDGALVCTPDEAKIEILSHLLQNKKHLLVEKPLISPNPQDLHTLRTLAIQNNTVCYTAYNHRFEPHIVTLKQWIDSGQLGTIYLCKFFYGNGTARDVRNSPWRDKGMGVFPDLGSHLLDWTLMLFGTPNTPPLVWNHATYENKAPDHFHFGFKGTPTLDYEMTLLSWRNTFRLDLFAENGSAHIDCLCKWGPSTLTRRSRKLPSGRPDETSHTLTQPDPTWQLEYNHWKTLCQNPSTNIENDLWINQTFLTIQSTLSR